MVGASIAPSFEFVCLIDVPLTKLGSLVLVKAEMNAQRNLSILENVSKVEIDRGVVGRIAAEDNQQIYFARGDVGNEISYRFGLGHRVRINRVSVENRPANIAKLRVDGVNQSMHVRRLVIARDDDTGIPMSSQIDQQRQEEFMYLLCFSSNHCLLQLFNHYCNLDPHRPYHNTPNRS